MTDLTKMQDRVKIFLPDGTDRIYCPVFICKPDTDILSRKGFEVNALWDTGSQTSVISMAMANWLHLDVVSEGWSIGAFGRKRTKKAIALAFPGNSDWYTMVCPAVFPKIQKGVDFIVGMDIIMCGDTSIKRTGEGSVMEFVFHPDCFINVKEDSLMEASKKRIAMKERIKR